MFPTKATAGQKAAVEDDDGASRTRELSIVNAGKLAEQLIHYSVWANRRVLAHCESLTAEELTRDLQGSFRSVLNTLWHIYDAEYFWAGNLATGAIPPLAQFGEPSPVTGIPPSLLNLREGWPEVGERLEECCSRFQIGDWEKIVTCDLPEGGQLRISRAQLAMHMVNHSTMHRGQVVNMLRQLGATAINTDLFGYFLSRQESDAG